jgi:hypothetical protein
MTTKTDSPPLTYIQWVALNTLYQHRDRPSSPLRYVGLRATIQTLIVRQPALAEWVGDQSNNQVHITAAGITACERNLEG